MLPAGNNHNKRQNRRRHALENSPEIPGTAERPGFYCVR